MGVFERAPEFIESDNRRLRPFNRVTSEQQELRHAAMLPKEWLAGKSVLDVGCCVGATGLWCLEHGAESYVGVEAQAEYADAARANLAARFGNRAEVIQADIEEFLTTDRRKFDIVVMAGVIYTFTNIVSVLESVLAITADCLVVESIFPKIQADGTRYPDESIIEVRADQPINLASQNATVLVNGSVPSPVALSVISARLGFRTARHLLSPWPGRYISTFQRGEKTGTDFAEVAKGGDIRAYNWAEDSDYQGATDTGTWVFDEKVASKFSLIARQNIPNYLGVQRKCLDVAHKICTPDDKIIDVGCATGETLLLLRANGFTNLYGVDNSQAMVDAASRSNSTIVLSETFPDDLGPFKMIMANWTLHFIERRHDYITQMYRSLQPDGALVLTDKMASSDLTRKLFHDFKRERGMTEEQIASKEKAINGILTSRPLEWYLDILRSLFRQVDVLDASYGFVTLLALK